MKNINCKSILRRISALTVAAALTLTTAYAGAGDQKLSTVRPLVEGLNYINTVTQHPQAGRVESHMLELGANSTVYPIMVQGAGTIYGAASINKAVQSARSMGYHVLGAINTDYFAPKNGVPMGMVIEDGEYMTSPEGPVSAAIAAANGRLELVENPQIALTLTNQRTGQQVGVHHLNKWRAPGGGLYLLNEHFSTVSTRTSTPGWMVRMVQETPGENLRVSGEMTLRVTALIQGSDPQPIGAGNYILTADEKDGLGGVFATFQEGDVITVSTRCNSPVLESAQWASGVGDVMIRNGSLTDPSRWLHVREGRAPRTAMGVRADGSVVLYVVDGRRKGVSGGLSQEDLALELLAQGCQWAVNLDGGGSTAMSVWVPGQAGPAIVNRPSDGRPRGCATYLLLVSNQPGDGVPARLVLKEDGLVVLTGTSVTLGDAAVLDNGLNVLDQAAQNVTIQSQSGLGIVEDKVYTAGPQAGTDTLLLSAQDSGLQGTGQIHVVNALTELNITYASSGQPITALNIKPGQQVAMAARGSYWGRLAMRDQSGVTWTVDGNVGTVDANGVFTANRSGGTRGTIKATAGGLTVAIPVSLENLHQDVGPEHWAYQAVEYCYERKLVSGISPSQYGPNYNIRRGDFLLMLYRAAGSPAVTTTVNFPDVAPTDYYADAIAWAQEMGLASGMQDGRFAPEINVTREQTFTILNRALPHLGIKLQQAPLEVLNQFSDKAQISDWAAKHAATLVANKFVGGSGGLLNPRGNLSRAEMAVLLYKVGTYDPANNPGTPNPPVEPEQVTGVALDQHELALEAGEPFQLTANLQPEGVRGNISWTAISSEPGIVSVSPEGEVINLNTTGQTVTVTITASAGAVSDSCTISCLPAQHYGRVSEAAASLNVRSGPSTDYEVIDRISSGMPVLIREELGDGWLHITYLSKTGTAASGYVSQTYITQN